MPRSHNRSFPLTRRRLLAGAAATTSLLAAPALVRAQGASLKVGVLLPRSGAQAGIGQDCQRGVDLANGIFKDLGLPELQLMNADTETNVDVARSRAEKLIADGAQLLVGAFDSGQSSAIAVDCPESKAPTSSCAPSLMSFSARARATSTLVSVSAFITVSSGRPSCLKIAGASSTPR